MGEVVAVVVEQVAVVLASELEKRADFERRMAMNVDGPPRKNLAGIDEQHRVHANRRRGHRFRMRRPPSIDRAKLEGPILRLDFE